MAEACPSPATLQEVWYEFLSPEHSARAILWGDLVAKAERESASPLVFRPNQGLDGWTNLDDVLARRASAPAASSEPSSQGGQAPPTGGTEGDEAACVSAVQPGLSVRFDPHTGGLIGLPASWAAVLPDGCATSLVDESTLPPLLRPPAGSRRNLKPVSDTSIVGNPFNVQRHSWRPAFDVPIEHCDCEEFNGVDVPRVLLTLREEINARDALREEGIFRVPGQKSAVDAAAEALNADPSTIPAAASDDAHVLAALVKSWFARLPEKLLATVPPAMIDGGATTAQCMQVLQSLPTRHKGVTLWLLDLMADVVDASADNKMKDAAIAIVFGPCLYEPPQSTSGDPMEALVFSKKVGQFVLGLLHAYSTLRAERLSPDSVGTSDTADTAAVVSSPPASDLQTSSTAVSPAAVSPAGASTGL